MTSVSLASVSCAQEKPSSACEFYVPVDSLSSQATDFFITGLPRSGVRASISNKLSKAKSTAGKGLNAVGRAGRQLGSSRSDLEDSTSSGTHVSAYAGLGPTGTAQEVSVLHP